MWVFCSNPVASMYSNELAKLALGFSDAAYRDLSPGPMSACLTCHNIWQDSNSTVRAVFKNDSTQTSAFLASMADGQLVLAFRGVNYSVDNFTVL